MKHTGGAITLALAMNTNTNEQLLPQRFRKLAELGDADRRAIRWLIRHADQNGIVEAGIVVRLGRCWWIDSEALPTFLAQRSAVKRYAPRREVA
jgi:hypothetical protein